MDPARPTALAHVRALLGVVSALRAGSVSGVLDAVAEAIAGPMSFETVVVNLYRPAWDDLEVVLVRGDDAAREALLGTRTSLEAWGSLLDARFDRGGAFFVPYDEHDWRHDEIAHYVPEGEIPSDPDGWHPEDACLLPLRSSDDELLGIISVDQPSDGKRPDDEDLDVLVAIAAHAAVALEQAQVLADAERERVAVDGLLHVSAQLTALAHPDAVLAGVCEGVRDALGFARVTVALTDQTGVLRPAATAGWSEDELVSLKPMPLAALEPLIDPVLEREGCYLASFEQARTRIPAELHDFFPSTANGTGRRAWNRHWLIVPLRDADGELRGVLWPDDPVDRLVPSPARLKALRAFANQAVSAIESAERFEDVRHLALHDPLTGLRNRQDFHEAIERTLVRASARSGGRPGARVALLVCDVDRFSAVNAALGREAGDGVLRRFAELLRDATRDHDAATRLGGDRFAVLLPDADVHGALVVAERLRRRVREVFAALPVDVTVSIGVADAGADGATAARLVAAASAARDLAKRLGGDRCIADGVQQESLPGRAGEAGDTPPGRRVGERR